MDKKNLVYPVILSVPKKSRAKVAKEKVRALRQLAREALAISAQKSSVVLGELKKNKNGAPIPMNGIYWSLTHKSKYVAAVTCREQIGIDIEEIRPCPAPLFDKIADSREWRLIDDDKFKSFFRYWTSKEAALKAVGIGLAELSKCHIMKVIDDFHLIVQHRGVRFHIEHHFFKGHIASVVNNSFQVIWTHLDENNE
ncbi:MAG: 4'-phosphopantetheinyl transferase superfamily protein [Desulfobacterales bacterium]